MVTIEIWGCVSEINSFIVQRRFERQKFLDHWEWIQVEIVQKLKLTNENIARKKLKKKKRESFQSDIVFKFLYIENNHREQISSDRDPCKICKQALQRSCLVRISLLVKKWRVRKLF